LKLSHAQALNNATGINERLKTHKANVSKYAKEQKQLGGL
jgi:hypothetical protein